MDKHGSDNLLPNPLVLGTAGLGGVWGPVEAEHSVATIQYAIDQGISWIDTAPAYGDAEHFVGRALRMCKEKRPYVSTKVGRLKGYQSDAGTYNYTPYAMAKSVAASLRELELSAVDILFLHEPAAIDPDQVPAAIQEMQALKSRGYAKKIGLGGNYPSSFSKYIKAGVFDVVMEYNRLNLCTTTAIDTSLAECRANHLAYWAASPLHMGLLGKHFEKYTQSKPDWIDQPHIDVALAANELAKAQDIPLAELAIRFLSQLALPIHIVIGPSNKQELDQTLNALHIGAVDPFVFQQLLSLIHQINNNELHNASN